MYSPPHRIYTTPEVSVPAAQLMLQKVRLERVFRRIGYLPSYNYSKCVFQNVTLPIKLPYIPTEQIFKPLNEKPKESSKLLHPFRFQNRNIKGKAQKSVKRGNERFDIEERFENYKRKFEDIHSKYIAPIIPKAELFKPFYPQKTPVKLPAIQKVKNPQYGTNITDTIKDDEVKRHIQQYRKDKSKEPLKTEYVKQRQRRKNTNLERYFHDWQETYDKKQKRIEEDSQLADFNILKNQEKFHKITDQESDMSEEQKYRNRISDNIKQSIRKKKSVNKTSFEKDVYELAPVCDMVFEKRSNFEQDIYIHKKKRQKPLK